MEKKILEMINSILKKKGEEKLNKLEGDIRFNEDLGLDSIDMAEITVRIEDEFGVDIFEDGIVNEISEVLSIIKEKRV